jgi:TolB-like protein/class 3 adenylate cyclase
MAEERSRRRLAAILAADVVGYARLMEQDETGTLAVLKARRKQVLEPLVVKYQGRVFKVTGDGVLVEFGSAVNAVQCAVDLQNNMAAANGDLPEARRIVLRIGINLGDVMLEGSDLYGDGVNIAARLEGSAEPGGILISGTAYDHVKNKVEVGFDDVGTQTLKNIAAPVRVYRITGTPVVRTTHETTPEKSSIAVLPFTNLSGDPAQEYFADGIVEDIISGLTRLHWLFVIARDSSFTYKGKAIDVKQVGRQLGVRYLLEGSVRRAGDRIRIASQLIDAATGTHIWTDRFDGTLSDIFDLQDRITASVVGAIEPKLRSAEIERARRKPTESVDAYDLFLRAVALNATRRKEDNKEALRLLYRAIEIDRRYAAAYALASYCYLRQKIQGFVSPADPALAEGMRMARLAAENAQDDPEALWMAGVTMSILAAEIEDGLALIDRSLALNPNSANALMASGLVRAILGDSDAAITYLERSRQLSPLDPIAYGTSLGFAYAHFMAGRYEEASAWCDRALHEAPTYFPPALRLKAACCGLLGRVEEARKWIGRLLAVNPEASLASESLYHGPLVKNPKGLEALLEGLRKAGLPE